MDNSISKYSLNEIHNLDSSGNIDYHGTRVILIMSNESLKLMGHLLILELV